MTKRYLRTIVSAALCAGASMGAFAATAPEDFVCNTTTGKGLCKPIKVLASLPYKEESLRHVVKDATFLLNKDGTSYSLRVTSPEWLPAFLTATQLDWKEGNKGTMSAELCQAYVDAGALRKLSPAIEAKLKKTVPSDFAHFATAKIPIHLKDSGNGLQMHTFQIFPIEDYQGSTLRFCLMFEADEAHGGSHDGAVHGDS